ncbi:MAG: ABC transporter ATP-binding protein [Candidatus Uhrbacteria bacterium]|nr:ABC transporter ATP-binding protein [Candidatus Uhrbacteria bacterium]
MNYELNAEQNKKKLSTLAGVRSLWPYLADERGILLFAALATIANSAINLSAPLLIAHVVDTYIVAKQFHGVLLYAGILLVLYIVGLFTSYAQTRLMGGMGQRVLFNLRTKIFSKLQELPVAFFNANKAGDLISRINNDTDQLNQFFSRTLVQFIGSIVIMIGSGIFLLSIHLKLGAAALAPALGLLIFTQLISPWVKRSNAVSLTATGGLSAEVSESLENFKVVVAFNRRDFFRKRFEVANDENYKTAMKAGIANNIFTPIYGFFANLAQLIVLAYGVYLISIGSFTLGLLVGFLSYIASFYNPLRQLASLWSSFQVALAGWDRVSAILQMDNNMVVLPYALEHARESKALLEFKDVSFRYTEDKEVLHHINLTLEKGKTYALVGPTGGGKTTTASLMARLYDPTDGAIFFEGRDIRTFDSVERTQKIGFILQEPILFSGTVRENILYGNDSYKDFSNEDLIKVLHDAELESLLVRFDGGLEAKVATSGDSLSLGQKQLIAFMRAVLRNPELLILDEATANIDTVTEQLLEDILKKLPKETTRVIIAHRLNTIENADEIFFVNNGEVSLAGSMEHAVDMLLHGKRES